MENEFGTHFWYTRYKETIRVSGRAVEVPEDEQIKWRNVLYQEQPYLENVYPGETKNIDTMFMIRDYTIEYFCLSTRPITREYGGKQRINDLLFCPSRVIYTVPKGKNTLEKERQAMTNATAKQIESMKAQTFGVEVEMNSITREKAAQTAASFFGTETVRYKGGSYCAWEATDRKGRTWSFQRDSSIQGPDNEKCEIVTPVLRYDDLEDLQELIRQLRHAGAKSCPSRGCGVHYAKFCVIGKKKRNARKTGTSLLDLVI